MIGRLLRLLFQHHDSAAIQRSREVEAESIQRATASEHIINEAERVLRQFPPSDDPFLQLVRGQGGRGREQA